MLSELLAIDTPLQPNLYILFWNGVSGNTKVKYTDFLDVPCIILEMGLLLRWILFALQEKK